MPRFKKESVSFVVAHKQKFLLGCLLLTFSAAAAFYPVLSNEFLNLDDHTYVTKNRQVQAGINLQTIKWAFTTIHAEFYHPMTWISLLLDTSLYGNTARGYLTTNLLLHIANTLLVFYVFFRMTGFFLRSLVVAALFALHPFHVETVAWISDRKDLLCTFFWFLSIWAYLSYQRQPAAGKYIAVVFAFILALLSKPMVITLPCALLLLDIWPLKRIPVDNGIRSLIRRTTALIKEKAPLFALAIVGGLIAIYAQKAGGGLDSIDQYPMTVRLGNAALSYYSYVIKTLWPHDLAVFYPYVADHPMLNILAALLFLITISGLAVTQIKRRPYLSVGWFWFLGTMVPSIGLFKIGDFAMADRYTYIPITGLFIMIVWGFAEIVSRRRMGFYLASVAAIILLTFFAILTRHQIKHWRNSEALYRHALHVTENNYMAHYGLAHSLASQGRFPEAVKHFRQAAELKPDKGTILLYLGRAMSQLGQYREAEAVLKNCVNQYPKFLEARFTLGLLFTIERRYELAVMHFSELYRQLKASEITAYKLRTQEGKNEYERARALVKSGQIEQAMISYERILDLQPEFLPARDRLKQYYMEKKDYDRALATFHIKNDDRWLKKSVISGYNRWVDVLQ